MIRRLPLVVASLIFALTMDTASATAAGSNCKLVRIAEWPIRIVRNQLIIDGAINNENIGIMLDTGAMRSIIFRAAAGRLKLNTRSTSSRMFGTGGESTVETAEPQQIRIGEVVRKGWPMLVAGERDFGEDVAMILGEDFFQRVDIEFDLAHNAVRLFQPLDCTGASLAYWSRSDVGEVEFERVDEATPQIVLPVKINGQSLDALLDCGSTASTLSTAAAARLGVTPETPGVVAIGSSIGIGSKSVPVYAASVQNFSIGNETIQDTVISFGDIGTDTTHALAGSRSRYRIGTGIGMLLGVDFLKAHRVLVAHSQRRIYFTYLGGPVFERTKMPRNGSAK